MKHEASKKEQEEFTKYTTPGTLTSAQGGSPTTGGERTHSCIRTLADIGQCCTAALPGYGREENHLSVEYFRANDPPDRLRSNRMPTWSGILEELAQSRGCR